MRKVKRPVRILVTRPQPDAATFAAALEARGHDTFIEPMMTIEALPPADAPLELASVQALLFTSANGVRIFSARADERALPVFAVGDATARTARRCGFSDVASAGGDVQALAALVRRRLRPDGGPLLHPAARKQAGDLKATLEAAGFTLRRCVLYQAVARPRFSDALLAAVRDGRIDAVSFFSPRTADAFARLAFTAGLSEALRSVRAVCLSRAVADRIAYLPWDGVVVAAQPTEDALLAALEMA